MKFKDAIEEVQRRTNIVDVIGQYVRLQRKGNNHMGLCPFHNENTPSFSVSESKQMYKCFGCGKGGNVYSFLMEHEGMTFVEALKFLASKCNVTIDDDYNYNKADTEKKQLLYKLYKDVANTYYKILYSDIGKMGLTYLINRKLTKETIKKFGLGYAPGGYGTTYKMMKEQGYDDKILFESKLFGITDKGPYDFFRERVMFPLVDINGNIVSFQGRILIDGEQKYINTAESSIYNKSRNLFALNLAKHSKKDFYILCEGNMDVISLHQAGFDNVVASWGTALTEDQVKLMKRKVRKVYLSQDTDSAGIKAIKRSIEICEKLGLETYVIDVSPAKDPDELIVKNGAEEFEKRILNALPSFLFLVKTFRTEYNIENDNYGFAKYINSIVSLIGNVDNSFIRDRYIKDISEQEKLSPSELHMQVDKYLVGNRNQNENKIDYRIKVENTKEETKNVTSNVVIEEYFINIILDDMSLKDKISSIVNKSEINDALCRKLYELYVDGNDTQKILNIINEYEKDERERANDIIFGKNPMGFNTKNENDDKDNISIINELIRKIKIFNLYKDADNDFDKLIEKNKEKAEIEKKVFI